MSTWSPSRSTGRCYEGDGQCLLGPQVGPQVAVMRVMGQCLLGPQVGPQVAIMRVMRQCLLGPQVGLVNLCKFFRLQAKLFFFTTMWRMFIVIFVIHRET